MSQPKEYFKKYYDNNRELILKKQRDNYKNNKNLITDKYKSYYQNNKEMLIQRQMDYYKIHKDEINEKYRTIKKKCNICNKTLTAHNFKHHLDSKKHIKNEKEWLYISKGI